MKDKEFGKYMQEKRLKLGLSMEELGRKSKVSAPSIMRIEKGITKNPSTETLKKLALTLDIPWQEILDNTGISDPSPTSKKIHTYKRVYR